MDERKEILLREYESLRQDNHHRESHFWVIAGIFISGNMATLGIIASAMLSRNILPIGEIIPILIFVFFLGIGLIYITYCLIQNQKRTNFIISSNYSRMREIEAELGIWSNWRIHGFDHWLEDKNDFDNDISENMKFRLLEYKPREWWEKWSIKGEKYSKPNRGKGAEAMMYTIIALWVLLIGTTFTFYFCLPIISLFLKFIHI